jgi:hypothetical protein
MSTIYKTIYKHVCVCVLPYYRIAFLPNTSVVLSGTLMCAATHPLSPNSAASSSGGLRAAADVSAAFKTRFRRLDEIQQGRTRPREIG